MHHSTHQHGPSTWIRCPRRSFTAAICAAALTLLPVATLRACDDEHDSPDFDAVAERLLEAVAEGELSIDHAEAMFAELARARFIELAEALEREWEEEEQEEEDEEWHEDEECEEEHEEEHRDDLRRHREDLTRLRGLEIREGRQESRAAASQERTEWAIKHLREVDCSDRQIREVMELLPKLVFEFQRKGLQGKPNREWVEHLTEEVDLEEKQVERVFGIAKRFAYLSRKSPEVEPKEKIRWMTDEERQKELHDKQAHDRELHERFRRLGVKDDALRRIHDHLRKQEFTPKQTRQTLGGIAHGLHALRSGVEPEALHERMEIHFRKEVGLSEKQFKTVIDLGERMLERLRKQWQDEEKRRERDEDDDHEGDAEHDDLR